MNAGQPNAATLRLIFRTKTLRRPARSVGERAGGGVIMFVFNPGPCAAPVNHNISEGVYACVY